MQDKDKYRVFRQVSRDQYRGTPKSVGVVFSSVARRAT